jgi:hypothetical protein
MRHPQVADDQQARRLAEVELRVVDQGKGAADEFHRHQPAAAVARRRRRQRDEAARHRRERLVGRQDNRFPFVGNGDGAERLLAHGQLEGRGEVVEGDELLVGDQHERQRAPAVFRQHGQRRRRRRLARERRGEGDQERGGDGDGEK